MNMAEWERQAAFQRANESRSTDAEEESDDGDQQWESGYLPSRRQPQYPPPSGYTPYNTAAAAATEPIGDSTILYQYPLYQAQSQAYASPYSPLSDEALDHSPTSGQCKLADETDIQDDRKPAANPTTTTGLGGVERDTSFESDSESDANWGGSFEPTPHYPPRSTYAQLPSHLFSQQHQVGEHPLRPQQYDRRSMSIPQRDPPSAGISHAVPTPEELAEAQTPRAKQALRSWYQRFNELLEYKAIHGNCNVPQKYEENPKLGVWVNKQRMEKKFLDDGQRSSMTAIKQRNLNAIGFQWAKRKGSHSWLKKYNELCKYKERNGNCNVPTKYTNNPALGRWVSTQRSEYKKFREGRSKHMDREKFTKLNDLGFRWEMLNQRSESDDSPERDH